MNEECTEVQRSTVVVVTVQMCLARHVCVNLSILSKAGHRANTDYSWNPHISLLQSKMS